MRNGETFDRQTVDQAMIWQRIECLRGPAHREMSGPEDIEAVDFLPVRSRHGPENRGIGGESFIKNLPFGSGDHFRIVEPGTTEAFWENYRCCGNRTRKWPSTRLINPCNPVKAAGVKGDFEGQMGHDRIVQNPLKRWCIASWELLTVANSSVQNTIPSLSTTTPMPV